LVGANKTLGNVTDIVGLYDNNFYWYNKADGSIEAGTAFLPDNFNNLTGDLHVTITGSQVPIPGSLFLLTTGLMGFGAIGWRRREEG
jgi:hypothetical protein